MQEKIDTPWSSVGYLTYKRTYARRLEGNNVNSDTEEFDDTVNRVVNAADTQLKCGFTPDESARLRKYMLQLKGTVAGRFLWQLGTPTVEKLGLASLQNCAFTVVDKPVEPFVWAMDMLMLGAGVGINIQKENVGKLPPVNINFKTPTRSDTPDADFIVPDSREGWVSLLGKTLKAAFLAHKSGKQTFTYSTQLIRGKGATIKGFGGTASGPEDLVWGIKQIGIILEKRVGKKLRPIDALDIMNIIGAIVVSGNVRRSAQIIQGDCDDVEFLLAKRWDMGNIPSWRSMSNNSVICDDINDLHDYFWDGYDGKGEPYGLINLKLSRKVGRTGETQYPDKNVMGYNPCLTGDTLVVVKDMYENTETIRLDALVAKVGAGGVYSVKSYNVETGKVEYQAISKAWLTRKDADVIKLTLSSDTTVKLTPDHKVYTENRGWIFACDLLKSDILVNSDKIECVLVNITDEPNEDVYDLTIDKNHNFFANGLLVHNCGEQSLADKETCCLAEIFLPNITTKEELLDVATLLYRVNKHSLALPCHQPTTEEIVHENMRMGIGITGFLQSTEEQKSWLSETYVKLREFDVDYSAKNGFNKSIKICTIKPSGSLSLLPGVTPGCHPAYARFMKRRIRIASGHSLVQTCRDHGFPVEYQQNFDGSTDHSTVVVTFPFRHPDHAVLAKDMTAIQQLETVKWLQANWSDNSVSCTVYYRKEELAEIRKYLKKNYKTNFKSLSFLLHNEHGFKQAPLEEITEDEYNQLVASTTLITNITASAALGIDESDCASGACPIR